MSEYDTDVLQQRAAPPFNKPLTVYTMYVNIKNRVDWAPALYGYPYQVAVRNSESPQLATVFGHHRPIFTMPADTDKANWYDQAVQAMARRIQPELPTATFKLTGVVGPHPCPTEWRDALPHGALDPTLVLFYVQVGLTQSEYTTMADQVVRDADAFERAYDADLENWVSRSPFTLSHTNERHTHATYNLELATKCPVQGVL